MILKGHDDMVFGDAINQRLPDAYPNARLLFFGDGHRRQRDPATYRAIRNAFLNGGFAAVSPLRQPLNVPKPAQFPLHPRCRKGG